MSRRGNVSGPSRHAKFVTTWDLRLMNPLLWMPKRQIFWSAVLFSILVGLIAIPRALRLESPDFKVFYVAARHVIESPENLYKVSPDRYLYPPVAAILLVPFAFTGNYLFHQGVWHLLLILILFLLVRSSWASLAAMAVLIRYLQITLGYGQINLVILALMAFVGMSFTGGALWAIASWLKVYPLVLLPMGFKSKAIGYWLGAVTTSLVLLFLTVIVFGVEGFSELHTEFFSAIANKGFPLHSHNQSFQALMMRLFTDQSFQLHSVGDTKWTLLPLSPKLVSTLSLLLGVGMASITWAKSWKQEGLGSMKSAAAFSLLFLSHIVWKDYLLFLFFPLQEIFSRGSKAQATFAGLGFFLVSMLSSPAVLGFGLSTRFDGACIHLWGAVLVWGVWWKLQNCRLPLLS